MKLKYGRYEASVTIATADTTGTFTLPSSGTSSGTTTEMATIYEIRQIKLVIPAITSNATTTLAIVDVDSETIYSIATLADATTHILMVDRIVEAGSTITLTLSAADGAAAVIVTIDVYFEY